MDTIDTISLVLVCLVLAPMAVSFIKATLTLLSIVAMGVAVICIIDSHYGLQFFLSFVVLEVLGVIVCYVVYFLEFICMALLVRYTDPKRRAVSSSKNV